MSPQGRDQSLPVRIMNAGFAPSNADVAKRVEEESKAIVDTTAIINNGQVANQDAVQNAIRQATEGLQDRIIRETAERSSVYIDPATMDVQQQLLNTNSAPDPSVIFWAQVQLWAQEDLFKAVADVNGGSKRVADSAIKHLLRVQVPISFVGTSPQPGAGGEGAAAPPSADPGAPIQPNFAVSPTGRASNGLFDVLHLEVSLVVQADRLPEVLNSLSRGRLLGVIQVKQVEPLDPTTAAKAGYYYGDRPCVRIDVTIEALLMRSWTTQYMPDRVKTALGIPSGDAAAAAAPPPG
jgi:hypothetical protein